MTELQTPSAAGASFSPSLLDTGTKIQSLLQRVQNDKYNAELTGRVGLARMKQLK